MSTYSNKRITRYERRTNSANGNPNYKVFFDDGTGAITSSDCSFSYSIGNPEMREGSLVKVQYTRAGYISDMQSMKDKRYSGEPF